MYCMLVSFVCVPDYQQHAHTISPLNLHSAYNSNISIMCTVEERTLNEILAAMHTIMTGNYWWKEFAKICS